MAERRRISQRMREVLGHIAAGRPSDFCTHGRSAYGGLSSVMFALRRANLIDLDERLTDAGRAALESGAGYVDV